MTFPGRPFAAGLELTLACPCRCATCGSDAGRGRPNELTTDEWRGVIDDLHALGCQRIGFLGGEPLVHPEWSALARHATTLGMSVEMITSGFGIDEAVAKRIHDSGFVSVTVSVDGLAPTHDRQRGVVGSHAQAMRAITLLDKAGMKVGVNTQVNLETLPDLEAMAPILQEAGALGWQWQMTMPTGRAAGRHDLILPPDRMPEVHALMSHLSRRRGLRPQLTDNLGYCTPDDTFLRTLQGGFPSPWRGCVAGLWAIGITSDGGVKGCMALPDSQREGNLRDRPLPALWNDPTAFAYNRHFTPQDLGGSCTECEYGTHCRGGCTAASRAFHGGVRRSDHCFRLGGMAP